MAPHLPARRVHDIELALLQDAPKPNKNAIASEFNTTYETVRQIWNRISTGKPPKPLGQRRVITREMDEAILLLLELEPLYYQDEIAEFLKEVFQVNVDRSTISRAIQRVELTRKRLRKEAAQRSPYLRQC